ncbi:MAG: hypothetical protein KGD67_11795 [Candidatus Lokiarchaeota archaeon]|nr:hypothetical protein [Candidatus Lokiarchaeota archaeon]
MQKLAIEKYIREHERTKVLDEIEQGILERKKQWASGENTKPFNLDKFLKSFRPQQRSKP